MSRSSRTPEGFPIRCSICEVESYIDPSLPPGDAVCPACGSLVWSPSTFELLLKLCEQHGLTPFGRRRRANDARSLAHARRSAELVRALEGR